MDSSNPTAPDDYKIAKAQYIKSKRAATRLRYALMADAEVNRNVSQWGIDFDIEFSNAVPQVLDLHSELLRLGHLLPEGEDA